MADRTAADLTVWDGRYVRVLTYRPDGSATACPVWCARTDSTLVFRTFAKTLKARRLRRDPRVGVAPCARDGQTSTPFVYGHARRLTGRAALAAGWRLTRRHGPVKPAADLYYRLTLGRVLTFAVELDECRDVLDPVAAP